MAHQASPPLLGISANPRPGRTGVAAFVDAFRLARSAGSDLTFLSYSWGELEKTAGKPDLQPIRSALGGLPSLGFTAVTITLKTLDTNQRALPADLRQRAFDDPEVLARWKAFLTAFGGVLTPMVRFVSLGNEVDIYLGEHRDEVAPYVRFLQTGYDALHGATHVPALLGVTVTHDGIRDRGAIVDSVRRPGQATFATYYPLRPDFGVRPVTDVAADFDRMVRAAGTQPLLLQEVGYPAAPLLGSSDALQAAFVDAVFDQLAAHTGAIGFLNYFLLHDFGDTLTDTLSRYYGGASSSRFRAYLGSLGLRRADGTPRPGWSRFVARGHSLTGKR